VVQACRIYITLSKIINTVMFSAADAKLAALMSMQAKELKYSLSCKKWDTPNPPTPSN
jgi:hypothetical protein